MRATNGTDTATTLATDESVVAAPAPNELLPGLLLAGGVLLATVMMLRLYIRTNKKRRAVEAKVSSDPTDRLDHIRERAVHSREPVERAMAEAEEVARRLSATLETKAARLESLIAEADAKLAALRAAGLETALAADATRDVIDDGLRSVLDELATAPASERPGDAAGSGAGAVPIGRVDPGVMGRARLDRLRQERAGGQRAGDPPTHADWRDEARALADQGVAPEQIADRVNRPVGQVELVLNLRK